MSLDECQDIIGKGGVKIARVMRSLREISENPKLKGLAEVWYWHESDMRTDAAVSKKVGKEKQAKEIALKRLEQNFGIKAICELTSLSTETVEALMAKKAND